MATLQAILAFLIVCSIAELSLSDQGIYILPLFVKLLTDRATELLSLIIRILRFKVTIAVVLLIFSFLLKLFWLILLTIKVEHKYTYYL